MITLVNILTFSAIAFGSAAISKFLDFCMEEGNILHWYYKLILKIGQVKTDGNGQIISQNTLFKPLGGCLICFNFYVSIPGFIWYYSTVHLMYDWPILFLQFWLYQSLSGYFVTIINRSYNG